MSAPEEAPLELEEEQEANWRDTNDHWARGFAFKTVNSPEFKEKLEQAVKDADATDSTRVSIALRQLKYDWYKGPQFYRKCDHQSVQSVVIVESMSGNITLQLPLADDLCNASGEGAAVCIVRRDSTSNTLTVSCQGSDKIDAVTNWTSVPLATDGDRVMLRPTEADTLFR